MKTIDHYFSVRGAFAHLGHPRLVAIARAHGRTIVHKPIKLSVTMAAIGAEPFDARPPLRNAYANRDFLRWAEHLGMEVHADPIHHIGALELPSGAIVAAQRRTRAGDSGDVDTLVGALLEALWRDDRDIADEKVVGELARGCGYEPTSLLAEALEPTVQLEIERNCREAVIRGVLGSPTYYVDGENFYGQDRLEFVERLVAGTARPSTHP